jgi:hypothetical protein
MSEMAALLLFFQDMSRTPPFALGENTKRGGWEDHKEHLTRRNKRQSMHETPPDAKPVLAAAFKVFLN